MRLPIFFLIVLAGCDAVEDDLPGKLVRVEVITQMDGCNPARFVGDAGVQFFGERADGGLVFTMSEQGQYGPIIDGGSLQSVQRQLVPAPNAGRAAVGDGAGCEGSFSAWERTVGGVGVSQEWPGANTCPRGPVWLPLKACVSTRLYNFTEVGACQLRCVRITPASGEVSCAC